MRNKPWVGTNESIPGKLSGSPTQPEKKKNISETQFQDKYYYLDIFDLSKRYSFPMLKRIFKQQSEKCKIATNFDRLRFS